MFYFLQEHMSFKKKEKFKKKWYEKDENLVEISMSCVWKLTFTIFFSAKR